MKAFPLFITVTDKPVIVFGGGEEAAAKLRLLLKTEAQVIAVAQEFEPAVLDIANLERIEADPLSFDLPAGLPFAYAATGDETLDAQIAERVRSKGSLVCAADQPAVSDFSTPAIVDRDPVVVAIGTEGTAPVLARSLKAQIEFLAEPGLGLIARAAAGLRQQVAQRLKPGHERRAFWKSFFSTARTERLSDANQILGLAETLMSGSEATSQTGSLTFIGTGTGDAELLTVAAHKALDAADFVSHDPLVSRQVLELARREASFECRGLGDLGQALEAAASGAQVVRLLAGSGKAAADEIVKARRAGLTPSFIPGVEAGAETLAPSRRPFVSFFARKAA